MRKRYLDSPQVREAYLAWQKWRLNSLIELFALAIFVEIFRPSFRDGGHNLIVLYLAGALFMAVVIPSSVIALRKLRTYLRLMKASERAQA